MRKQPYAYEMPEKYTKGLDPKTARRRAAAQKLRTKKYKAGKMTPADYKKKLPGD